MNSIVIIVVTINRSACYCKYSGRSFGLLLILDVLSMVVTGIESVAFATDDTLLHG